MPLRGLPVSDFNYPLANKTLQYKEKNLQHLSQKGRKKIDKYQIILR
jgi:hypothetical protein